MEIIWMGNSHTNSSSREGHVPFVIVNHISAGTMSSMDSWFTSPANQVSSAHFGIARDGRVHQYVSIDRMAWANGLSQPQLQSATAPVVEEHGVNPNLYTVSIEHEGLDGGLTEPQFVASVQLHHYIRSYIKEKWGRDFPLDPYHVIGHNQINPIQKPDCPGPHFPWDRIYRSLAETEQEDKTMDELLGRLSALEQEKKALEERLEAVESRLGALEEREMLADIPGWAAVSVAKAVAQGLIDTPSGGSYDFYRFVVILDRKGLLD